MKENKKDKVKKNKPEKASSVKKEKKDGKLKKFFQKVNEILSKKWLVNTSTTILLVAIIFVIYLGVTLLLDKVTLPEIDLTKDKLYSLSEETETKVKDIDKDIKITLINYGSNDTMQSIINKYKALNKKISVENIDDLTTRSDILEKYSISTDTSLILVSCGDNETALNEYDLYTYDYSTYEQIDTTEEAITNAIVDVTTEVKPKVYLMSNHTKYSTSYYSTFMQVLKDDANEVETIDIFANGSVPDDCDCLVITSLKEDITETEKDSIIAYINRGGELLLLCSSNINSEKLPNLEQILATYGLKLEEGYIFEGKSANMLNGYPDIIVEDLKSSSITKNMDMNLKVAFVDASAITKETDEEKLEELAVEYEDLITTTEKSFIRTNVNITSASRTDMDSEESSNLIGVLATKTIDEGTTSKLILYSNELFATDMGMNMGNYSYSFVDLYNNQDIIANSISYLNEKENTITIRKNYELVTYSVTQSQHNIIMAIIFITPILIIIIGIIVWQVRRKRNK